MRLALYEPDIPQNTGTILRLAACLGLPVDIIEPAGFPVTDRAFRRAGRCRERRSRRGIRPLGVSRPPFAQFRHVHGRR